VKVVIAGAGVAGLVCGRTLQRAGHEVVILEASDGVGGRVRSDKVDGFTLDRGFQVLFTAYPAAQRQLEYSRLNLQRFDPGALICKNGERHILTDPSRNPQRALPAILTNIISPFDKLRTLQFATELKTKSVQDVIAGDDDTIVNYVHKRGFSDKYVDNFIRPFFGGVFLDRSLQTSAKAFKFNYKMLSDGETVVPAGGMGQISEQIAEELFSKGAIRLNSPVAALLQDESGRYTGARLENGETVSGDAVVIATPVPEAARLTGQNVFPLGQVGEVNLYFSGTRAIYKDKKILLNANADAFVNNASEITNVAPQYAPEGKFLLSVVVLGVPDASDADLFDRAFKDLRRMLQGDTAAIEALMTFRPLKLYRIPYGQFAQPPGIHPQLPDNISGKPGLYYAAEFTEASSINAAMISGEKAADAILRISDA
jgi:phytoene dehydrogenase-like protein